MFAGNRNGQNMQEAGVKPTPPCKHILCVNCAAISGTKASEHGQNRRAKEGQQPGRQE